MKGFITIPFMGKKNILPLSVGMDIMIFNLLKPYILDTIKGLVYDHPLITIQI